jgi:hypothetical protein
VGVVGIDWWLVHAESKAEEEKLEMTGDGTMSVSEGIELGDDSLEVKH